MASTRVGEIHAELGLDDKLEAKLSKAEANFKSTAKNMDAEAKLGLDSTGFEGGLSDAERKARKGGKAIGDELGDGVGDADLKGVGSNMGGLILVGAAGAVAAGGALLTDAFGKALDRGDATAKLGIQLGLSPEDAKAAGALTGDVYKQAFGDSFDEVGSAVRFVSQNITDLGSVSDDEFKDMTKGVLVLSDAFDQDLGKTTAAAGTLIKTGLAKDGMEALDLLTRGLQGPANKADDLLDTFIEYSTEFRQLGITGPQALGLLNQGLAAGARDSDTVADALKEFVIQAQTATDAASPAAVAFEKLGLNGADMAARIAAGGPGAAEALQMTLDKMIPYVGTADGAQIATGLFGTKAEDLQGALGALDLSTATTQVGNVEGAMTDATSATETNRAKVEEWKRTVDDNVTNYIGETLIPRLEELWGDWDKGNTFAGDFHHGLIQLGDGFRFLKDEAIDPIFGSMQTLFGWMGDIIEKGEEFFGSSIGQFLIGAGMGSMGAPGGVLTLLSADGGGVVPGPVGSSQLVMAHGGETIVPTHKMSAADAFAAGFGGQTGMGAVRGSGGGAGGYRPRRPTIAPDRKAQQLAVVLDGRAIGAATIPRDRAYR